MSFPFQKKYDVVVVGAGPAGSLAAKYAAIGGADVLLIDRKKEIGTPIQCAGFIPAADELENLIPGLILPSEMTDFSKECLLSQTSKQKIISPDLSTKEFAVGGFVVDRKLFDSDLSKQAASEGADVLCGTVVQSIDSIADGHILKLSGDFGTTEVSGKIIIGADGPSSLVGKTFGLVHSKKSETSLPYERGIGFGYKMTNVDIDSETLEMYFGNKYVPGGYVWIFPEGEGKANVGLGLRRSLCKENISARAFLNRFIKEHPIASEKLKGGKIESIIGGIIPVDGAPEKTATERVMIAGDAAGHVLATNGGGIPFAMAAGKIAGETAAEALKNETGRGIDRKIDGKVSEKIDRKMNEKTHGKTDGKTNGKIDDKIDVSDYEKKWRADFGNALEASVQARKMMDKFMMSDKLMNAAFKLMPAERLKEMQCGYIPTSIQKGLNLLLK